jgi:peptidoglycan LD-endopeptidase LytH
VTLLLVAVLLSQLTAVVCLLIYLAATRQSLVLEVVAYGSRALPAAASPHLIVPVAGVHHSALHDSFSEKRSGGRTHKAIDIMAAAGTPVLAAAAGVVVALDSSELGGISLYERDLDGRTIYYYAHLRGYFPGLKVGDLVRQGDVLGFVGETGNVPPGGPHLHFAVHTASDPNQWGHGVELNPCELLQCGAASATPVPESTTVP